jgi:hypothetical protein
MPLLSDISMVVTFVFSLFVVTEAKYYKWGMDYQKINLSKTLPFITGNSVAQCLHCVTRLCFK